MPRRNRYIAVQAPAGQPPRIITGCFFWGILEESLPSFSRVGDSEDAFSGHFRQGHSALFEVGATRSRPRPKRAATANPQLSLAASQEFEPRQRWRISNLPAPLTASACLRLCSPLVASIEGPEV